MTAPILAPLGSSPSHNGTQLIKEHLTLEGFLQNEEEEPDNCVKLLTFVQNMLDELAVARACPVRYPPMDVFRIVYRMTDQAVFLLTEWGHCSRFFRNLPVKDQMRLLKNCWSQVLMLKIVCKMVTGERNNILETLGERFGADYIRQLEGLEEVHAAALRLAHQFKTQSFTMTDYVCLKYMLLLDPDVIGLSTHLLIENAQDHVQSLIQTTGKDRCAHDIHSGDAHLSGGFSSLLQYASHGGDHEVANKGYAPSSGSGDRLGVLLFRLPEIRKLGACLEKFLFQHSATQEFQQPCLLLEMLQARRSDPNTDR